MQKTVFSLLIFCLFFSLSACKTLSSQWTPQAGKVLNKQNRPVNKAFVVALWRGAKQSGQSTCYHVETDLSKNNGTYRIKAWKKPDKLDHIDHQAVDMIVYKPGYIEVPDNPMDAGSKQNVSRLNRLNKKDMQADGKSRLKYLQKLVATTSCDLHSDGRKKLKHMYQAILKEAKRVAKTPADKKVLTSLKRWTRFVSE